MRKLVSPVLWFFLLVAAGCRQTSVPSASDAARAKAGGSAASAASGSPPPAGVPVKPQFSYVNTADVRARPQLLSGWHAIEDGAFRWTEREARAVLLAPQDSPADFELRLFFPENHMRRAGGPVIVSVLIEGALFAQETYDRPGPYTLRRPVPPGTLAGPSVNVTLRVDRAVPPSDTDKRELGAVVQGFGFLRL